MLTVAQVAEECQIDQDTVRTWINSGQLAAVNVSKKLNGKKPRWRVKPEALRTFLERRSNCKTEETTSGGRKRAKPARAVTQFFP